MKFIQIILIGVLIFSSCSVEQQKEMRKVTARGLGNGLSGFLMNDNALCNSPMLECSDPIAAQRFIVSKTCDLLKADCGNSRDVAAKGFRATGMIKRFICKAAAKIILPSILPSKRLPQGLKDAGCKMTCADNFISKLPSKLCAKL